MIYSDNGKLLYTFDGETLEIQAWGKGLRVRATKNANFTDNNWALDDDKSAKGDIEIKKDPIKYSFMANMTGIASCSLSDDMGIIKNGKTIAEISKVGIVTFKNDKGEVLLKENLLDHCSSPHVSLNRRARDFKPLEGDNYKLTMYFKANDDEKLYGMGQYQNQQLNRKGCTLELAQRNSQVSIPFVISSLGYGFLWNNPAIGRATFGTNETAWVAESTKQMDYWICAGDNPAEIEEAYADVVGKAPMMPDYGMGYWQCKLRYYTQEQLLEVARKHKKLGLPMDVIVADAWHWTKGGEWKWDPKFWPDVKAMCDELESMGIKLLASVWPDVKESSENYAEMLEKGYLVRTEAGAPITMNLGEPSRFIDMTNPGAVDFIWKRMKENYWDKGVRLFWLDEIEPEYISYDFDNYRYYIGSDKEVGNIFPLMYTKGYAEKMAEEGLDKPLLLCRCAWVGSQKYGALVWSGDIDATFESLKRQIKAGLSMGLAGIPWWTTDTGGFYDCDVNDPEYPQLLVRWFEFSTFSPVLRMHGVREPLSPIEGDNNGLGATGADNEVWSYGEESFEIMKKYLMLRERIRPYIKEQMSAAHEKGTPVMRPLFYDFPDDSNAWDVDDQYMFGPDVLVAPVLEKDSFERCVYLPEGAKWKNAWSDEVLEGGQCINVKAELDTIPVFIKDGKDIPIKG